MNFDVLPPAKLLLVDDQPNNLIALEAILEPLGQTLIKASSGKEALKQVLAHDFAVILLDVQMPEMDGFETAMLIRKRERSRHVPVIFLTAISKEEKFVLKGYTVGAVDYLLKPFDADILRSKVNTFIELYKKNEIIQRQSELLRLTKEKELADVKRVSEERYVNLAESMPHVVWVSDAVGAVRYRNRRWTQVAGEGAATAEIADIVHPDDQRGFVAEWSKARKARTEWSAELRLGDAKRGAYRWNLVKVVPTFDGKGIASWIGTATDIDDRRMAEEKLRLIAEASTLLGSSLQVTGALEQVAARAVPLLGDACFVDVADESGGSRRLTARSLSGESGAHARLHDEPRLAIGTANAILTGEREVFFDVAKDAELAFGAKVGANGAAAGPTNGAPTNGTARGTELLRVLRELGVTSYMAIPIVSREHVFGAITLLNFDSGRRYDDDDVTLAEDLARRAGMAMDNARLYATAENERAKLDEANRAKDVFLATLSHELRTPLNAMMGWTQILRSGPCDEARFKRALDTIDRNAKAQAQLIADLLDVSRIVSGKLKLEALPVELAPLIDGIIDASRPAADARGVVLEAEVDPRAGEVRGDPVRLQQIVSNLVSNAIKFTPQGGRVKVTLSSGGRGGGEGPRARIVVADSGQGIRPEFLPYVFDRFRQADSTTTRTHGGLGLGLAIVKHLVELHGGSVAAASEGIGKGAVFTVELPASSEVIPAASTERLVSSANGEAEATLQGLAVLLVEDDDDGRELVKTMLEHCGARVTAVGTSAAALDAMGKAIPDVLVSDIGLPEEDGFALIRKVRALPRSRGCAIPAVALTAYASREDTARALSAGFHAHVAKPVSRGELSAAILKVMSLTSRMAPVVEVAP